jgi:hypothetical protein
MYASRTYGSPSLMRCLQGGAEVHNLWWQQGLVPLKQREHLTQNTEWVC